MRGLLFPGDRRVTIEEFDDPVAGSGQVVVAMRAAAICGSDLHGYRAPAETRIARIIPGHEPSGVVHAIGDGVTNVKVGDRVAVYHYLGCGYCPQCLGGRIMWCPDRRGYGGPIHGSDADLLLTDARNCLPLPDDASFELGAILMCVGGTAYQVMKKLEASGRSTIAVFGLGPVGLAGVLMGRAMGAEVIGIDISPQRLQLAKELGANAVVDSANEDAVAAIKRWSGADGVSGAFETSGNFHAQQNAVAATGRAGKVGFVGFSTHENAISPAHFIEKQLTLFGSFVFPIDAYDEIYRFVKRHDVQLEATVTHRVPLDAAPDIFGPCDRGETGKVIFTWN
jgi:propanol-preferring alcohol dehydrogenase